ncbi:MAG: GNAT family N-acetyltransferase [Dehalococcoidia bacterium]|nr:GNAT family N-acetyltransferase [Dehalococcoidia bacterium]
MATLAPAKFRRAGHRDRDAVARLWESAGLAKADDDEWQALTHGAAARLLLSHEGGELAGSIVLSFDGWRAYIYHLAVAPQARGRGLGTALMDEAEAYLRTQGARRIYVEVGGENTAGLALCAACGYLPEGDVTLVKELRG